MYVLNMFLFLKLIRSSVLNWQESNECMTSSVLLLQLWIKSTWWVNQQLDLTFLPPQNPNPPHHPQELLPSLEVYLHSPGWCRLLSPPLVVPPVFCCQLRTRKEGATGRYSKSCSLIFGDESQNGWIQRGIYRRWKWWELWHRKWIWWEFLWNLQQFWLGGSSSTSPHWKWSNLPKVWPGTLQVREAAFALLPWGAGKVPVHFVQAFLF